MTVVRRKQQRPKWFVWLPLFGAACIAIGIALGAGLQGGSSNLATIVEGDQIEANTYGVGPIEEVLRYIEAKYVESVDRSALIDGAVNNLLAELDPHSSFIPASRLREHQEQLDGNATGIGIDVLILNDSVTVVETLPESPAALAGLMSFDRIISIGDSLVSRPGITPHEVERILHEQLDRPILLTISRRGEQNLLQVSVSATALELPTVKKGLMIDDETAYIAVTQFGLNTYQEFMRELERLTQDSSAQHLVLDLRGNNGGYLKEAVSLLSQLFPESGKLLVYTEGANSPRKEYESTGRVFFPIDRVAVLIDQGSASASEVVAAAVQDWDRGVIVGERSFGKGLVQERYRLKAGGALHITVSRYYTPSGRSIQRSYEDLGDYKAGFSESETNSNEQKFVTASGREVFGGGGVSPDISIKSYGNFNGYSAKRIISAIGNHGFELSENETSSISAAENTDFDTILKDLGINLSKEQYDDFLPIMQKELKLSLTEARLGNTRYVSNKSRLSQDNVVLEALKFIKGAKPVAKLEAN